MGATLDKLIELQSAANAAAGQAQEYGSNALEYATEQGSALAGGAESAMSSAKEVGGSLLDQAVAAAAPVGDYAAKAAMEARILNDKALKKVAAAREKLRVSKLSPEERKAEENARGAAKLERNRAQATLAASAFSLGADAPIRGGFEALKSLGNDMTMGEGYRKGVKDQQVAVSDAKEKLPFYQELLAEGVGSAIGPGKALDAVNFFKSVGPGMAGAGKKAVQEGTRATIEGMTYDSLHNQDIPDSFLDALNAGTYFAAGTTLQGIFGEAAPRIYKWATGKMPGEHVGSALYGATGRDREAFLEARKAAQQDGSGIVPTIGGSAELPIESPTTLMDMTNSSEPERRLGELTAHTTFPRAPRGPVGKIEQRSHNLIKSALDNSRREQQRIRLSHAIGVQDTIGKDMAHTQAKMRKQVQQEAQEATSERYDRFYATNKDSTLDYDSELLPNLRSGMDKQGAGFTTASKDGDGVTANLTGDAQKIWQETIRRLRPQHMNSVGDVELTPRFSGGAFDDAQPLGETSMEKLVSARQNLNSIMQAGRFLDQQGDKKIDYVDMQFAAALRKTLDDEIDKLSKGSKLGAINFDYRQHMKKLDAASDGAAIFNGMENYKNPITGKNAVEHYRSLTPTEQLYLKNSWYNELDKKMSSDDALSMLGDFFGAPIDRGLSDGGDYANEMLKYRKDAKNVRILEEIIGADETARLAKMYDVNANRAATAGAVKDVWEERTLEGMTHSSPVSEAIDWRQFSPLGNVVGGPGRASVTGEAAMRKRFGTPGPATAELIARLKTSEGAELESLLDKIDKDWLSPRSISVGGRAGAPLAMSLSPNYDEEQRSPESLMDELRNYVGQF